MLESLLMVLPEPMEEALMAAHVLSQYMVTRLVMARDARNVTIVCPCEEIIPFVQSMWIFAEVVKEATPEQVENANMTFEFDTTRCYSMTEKVEKGIADSLAIQLGVGLWRSLPAVFIEQWPEEKGLVLLAERNNLDGVDDSWEWPHKLAFLEEAMKRDIPLTTLPAAATWDETKEAVACASLVVGVRSTATLIACAANKLVVEMTPSDKGHANWFKKTDKPFYRMMYGPLGKMTADFVWKHAALLVSKTQSHKPRETETVSEDSACMIHS